MKAFGKIGQIVFAVLALISFLLLPLMSFKVVVPLYNISGYRMAKTFNDLALIPIGLMLLMVIAGLIGKSTISLIISVVSLIALVLGVIFGEDILLSGNINALYLSVQFLADRVPKVAELSGNTDIKQILKLICEFTLRPGIGFYSAIFFHICYMIMSFVGGKQETSHKFSGSNMSGDNAVKRTVPATHSNPKAF